MPGNKNSGRKKKACELDTSESSLVPPPEKRSRGRPSKPKPNDAEDQQSQMLQENEQLQDALDTTSTAPKPVLPSLSIRTSATSRGWDQAVGTGIEIIPQSRLPTRRIILKRYRALREKQPLEDKFVISKQIAAEVLNVWSMAPKIPIYQTFTVERKVLSLVEKHLDTKPASNRLLPKYQTYLDELFDLCSVGVDLLKKMMLPEHQVDYDFYMGMQMVPQVGSICTTTDVVLVKKKQVAEERREKYLAFQKKNMITGDR